MKRRLRALALYFVLVAVGLQSWAPSGAAAASPPEGIDAVALARVWDSMSLEEQAVRYEHFKSGRYSIVAYDRRVQAFDPAAGSPIDVLSPSSSAISAAQATSGISNLTISISVAFDHEVPCCRWDILNWFDWTGKPPYNGSGKDQLASTAVYATFTD